MIRRYKSLMVFALGLTLLIGLSCCMSWWLSLDNAKAAFLPGFNWLHDIGRWYLIRLSGIEGNGQSLLLFLFPFLYTTVIFSFVNIGFIGIFVLVRRWYSLRTESRLQLVKDSVSMAVLNYLYGEETLALTTLQDCPENVVIKEIVGLRKSIIGSKANKLQELFYKLKLNEFVMSKIDKSMWYDKIFYLEAALWMRMHDALPKIEQYLQVDNPYLRNTAQVAFVNLDAHSSFSFLHELVSPLPVWHQHALYQSMVRNSIPLPDFYSFLGEKNDTVVSFALIMIRIFDQHGQEEAIVELLHHPDSSVRLNAILAIRSLKIHYPLEVLKTRFQSENLINQVAIIKAMKIEKTAEIFSFIQSIWAEITTVVQLELLKNSTLALREQMLKELPQDEAVQRLVATVADKPLNYQL
jgi:hypothetical protein